MSHCIIKPRRISLFDALHLGVISSTCFFSSFWCGKSKQSQVFRKCIQHPPGPEGSWVQFTPLRYNWKEKREAWAHSTACPQGGVYSAKGRNENCKLIFLDLSERLSVPGKRLHTSEAPQGRSHSKSTLSRLPLLQFLEIIAISLAVPWFLLLLGYILISCKKANEFFKLQN